LITFDFGAAIAAPPERTRTLITAYLRGFIFDLRGMYADLEASINADSKSAAQSESFFSPLLSTAISTAQLRSICATGRSPMNHSFRANE
jgi:hypothetical protein